MNDPTDTPRTDAWYAEWQESWSREDLSLDLCRQLERELAETKEKLAIAMRFAETRLENINILTQK
jgi:hypothetical protein